jgi:uncharacterized protein (TIGR02118 family)
MRTVAFLQRRADLTRCEFRTHYEERHVELALPQLGGLYRYVRNHVDVDSKAGPPPFDAVSEFDYASADSFDSMSARLASQAGDTIREDELRFMHKPGNSFFASALAATGRGTRPAAGNSVKTMAVLQRAHGEKREALAARAYNTAASIEAQHGAVASQIDVALAGDPLGPPAFDVVVHLWYPPEADASIAVETLADALRGGGTAHCFAVLECETALQPAASGEATARKETPR